MSSAIFYSGTRNASSWAMRAWLALRESRVEFREEVIDIRRPQRFANLTRIGRFSPPAMVPVLAIDGAVIFDSLAIMEFANDLCGGTLLPTDPVLRAKARSILAWQHAGLSNICSRISFESAFYPYKRALTKSEVAEVSRLSTWLQGCLLQSGGPYLFGDLSLADLTLVPAVLRLTRHDIDLSDTPEVEAWVATLLARPTVTEWITEADALPHIWYDDYLIPETRPELRCALADKTQGIGAVAPVD